MYINRHERFSEIESQGWATIGAWDNQSNQHGL
jgi:hypothetical protein